MPSLLLSSIIFIVSVGCCPLPVTVTTRIITCLVGNPYKPSFATVTGWGVDPMYQFILNSFVRDRNLQFGSRGLTGQNGLYNPLKAWWASWPRREVAMFVGQEKNSVSSWITMVFFLPPFNPVLDEMIRIVTLCGFYSITRAIDHFLFPHGPVLLKTWPSFDASYTSHTSDFVKIW